MSTEFWLGFACFPALVLAIYWCGQVVEWFAWWRRYLCTPEATRNTIGKGVAHDFLTRFTENEKWGGVRHYHYWPPSTPWWIVYRFEWLRVRLCLRNPENRPMDSEAGK